MREKLSRRESKTATSHNERRLTTTSTTSLQEEPKRFPPQHSHWIASLLRIFWNHSGKMQCHRGQCFWLYTSDKIPKNSKFEVNMDLNAPHAHHPKTGSHFSSCSSAVRCQEFHRAWELQGDTMFILVSRENFSVASARTVKWEGMFQDGRLPQPHRSLHQQRRNQEGRSHSVTVSRGEMWQTSDLQSKLCFLDPPTLPYHKCHSKCLLK